MTSQKVTLNTFNDLYEQSYQEVSKYVVCNCSKIDDIEDIIQNIYLEVFKLVKNNKEINLSYIMGITKNKVKDYYRFKYKDKILSFFNKEEIPYENIPSNFNLEKTYLNKYDAEKVWSYLKKKNIIIFKVFYLYYYIDLSLKEIATTLNISESNVKHYLYRTLKELNIYLERDN